MEWVVSAMPLSVAAIWLERRLPAIRKGKYWLKVAQYCRQTGMP
jgi:hypothetical protein